MSKTEGLRPGEKTPVSGQYQELGPRGGKGPEVTMPKGHTLPPTSKTGATYKLVDKTKHSR
jgi:hypothetical protein